MTPWPGLKINDGLIVETEYSSKDYIKYLNEAEIITSSS